MVQVGRPEVVTWSQGMKSHYRHIDICRNIKKEVTGVLIDSNHGGGRQFHHLILQTEIETWKRKDVWPKYPAWDF